MPWGNKISMQKFAVPKRVQLSEGRVFYAKYKRIRRVNLPPNVRIQQTYKKSQGGRGRQKGHGVKSALKKVIKRRIRICTNFS